MHTYKQQSELKLNLFKLSERVFFLLRGRTVTVTTKITRMLDLVACVQYWFYGTEQGQCLTSS